MKLLVVLSIKEYQEQVANLLHDAGVKRFSVSKIIGYRKKEENLGWFAANASNAKTNSIMLFTFVSDELANRAIDEINSCNVEMQDHFPVHAFVMDVEKFSKLI